MVGSKSPCLASLSVSHSQAYWYPPGFLIAIRLYIHYEKGPRVCHAERQRSIWSHQPGGVAHADASLPLRMTRQGVFVMVCRKKALSHVMLSGSEASEAPLFRIAHADASPSLCSGLTADAAPHDTREGRLSCYAVFGSGAELRQSFTGRIIISRSKAC